ncbi:MAG: hypothetical protein KDA25_11070, partial [Phycisphaerales bacterium]|nr:hypothetical protein [Phycisphaerales bacterium]
VATVPQARSIDVAADGGFFCGHEDNGTDVEIWRLAPDGTPTLYGPPLQDPDVAAVDRDGALTGVPGAVLVAGACTSDPQQGCVHAVWPDRTSTIFIGPDAAFPNPGLIAVDHAGRVLFADGGTVFVGTAPGTWSIFVQPGVTVSGLGVDARNRVYVSGPDGVVRQYDANATLLTAAYATDLGGPTRLTYNDGDRFAPGLYAMGYGQDAMLRHVEPAGNTPVVSNLLGYGLVFGLDGALYFTHRPTPATAVHHVYRVVPCPGNVNDDATVDAADLAILLSAWGPNPGHPADLDGDGDIGPADLAAMLGAWGPCE